MDTDATVKTLAENYTAPSYAEPEAQTAAEAVSDPTIANEAATEIEAGDGPLTNGHGHAEAEPAPNGLANANVADEAANTVAESQWDTSNQDMSISQEWVDVPKPTDAEASADSSALDALKPSWADDHPDHPDPAVEVGLFTF